MRKMQANFVGEALSVTAERLSIVLRIITEAAQGRVIYRETLKSY